MVHQSHVYFERCHAGDYDPRVANDQRHACWAAWIDHYSDDQPPERVAYARERLGALEEGIAVDPLPGVEPTTRASSTSAFLSSSASSELSTDAPPEVESDAPPRQAPSAHGACAPVCAPRWDRCVANCAPNASACERACEAEHRTCMRGCY
jgi:hypothetical protein